MTSLMNLAFIINAGTSTHNEDNLIVFGYWKGIHFYFKFFLMGLGEFAVKEYKALQLKWKASICAALEIKRQARY